CYTAARAQSLSRRRQQRNKSRFKLVRQPELLSHVVDRLAMGWSPQQPRACINFKTPKEQNQTVALAT
ncbi:MAG: hypothetical protein AAF903_13425, partial [Pseudomonadota bacterium]